MGAPAGKAAGVAVLGAMRRGTWELTGGIANKTSKCACGAEGPMRALCGVVPDAKDDGQLSERNVESGASAIHKPEW